MLNLFQKKREPNPDDPLANDVAAIWKSNKAQAVETGLFILFFFFWFLLWGFLFLLFYLLFVGFFFSQKSSIQTAKQYTRMYAMGK